MAETPHTPDLSDVPVATVVPGSRRSIQLVWLIPLVAALVGGWLAVKAVLDRGPTVTITFNSAEGLEAGKTKLKYKGVDVGLVKSVTLASDASKVVATAELVKEAEPYLREDARFWVVRARISGATVSGLGTLLSGSYIGVDIGKSGRSQRDFAGLNAPPAISSDVPGREFILRSDDLGSIDIGSPIYFRRLQAGQVAGYDLDKDGKGVTIKAFINEPYDKFVNANTRFWQASGVEVSLDANGVQVQTQSIVSLLIGGLAFETPAESAQLPAADARTAFTLFSNRAAALKNPDLSVTKAVLVFRESVRGLAIGAPVDFRGIVIGDVAAIRAELDDKTKELLVPVEINLYPQRLRARSLKLDEQATFNEQQRVALVGGMVARGLRAQLQSSNLLTGQLYVALDFFPRAPAAALRKVNDAIELPVAPSTITELHTTIAAVAKKIEDLDVKQIGSDMHETMVKIQSAQFDRVGDDMHRSLQNADKLMARLDGVLVKEGREFLAEARRTLTSADSALKPDSPLSQDARDAMREIARAAQALRVFLDYLERHPEALLSGKKADNVKPDGGARTEDKR